MKDNLFIRKPAKSFTTFAWVVFVACLSAISVKNTSAATNYISNALTQDCRSGYTCFYNEDYDRTLHSKIGKIRGNNISWYFGRGKNWQDRADYFYNRGSSGMNICIYPKSNFRGQPILVLRHRIIDRKNFGRSNKWVWGHGCPWYGY